MESHQFHAAPRLQTRPVGVRIYTGLNTGGRRAPATPSFQPRAANDDVRLEPRRSAYLAPWMTILGGAVLAVVVGALLGGLLQF